VEETDPDSPGVVADAVAPSHVGSLGLDRAVAEPEGRRDPLCIPFETFQELGGKLSLHESRRSLSALSPGVKGGAGAKEPAGTQSRLSYFEIFFSLFRFLEIVRTRVDGNSRVQHHSAALRAASDLVANCPETKRVWTSKTAVFRG
jgi:hypothetical protein